MLFTNDLFPKDWNAYFIGTDDHTFFGPFERNNNLYASVRYGF